MLRRLLLARERADIFGCVRRNLEKFFTLFVICRRQSGSCRRCVLESGENIKIIFLSSESEWKLKGERKLRVYLAGSINYLPVRPREPFLSLQQTKINNFSCFFDDAVASCECFLTFRRPARVRRFYLNRFFKKRPKFSWQEISRRK